MRKLVESDFAVPYQFIALIQRQRRHSFHFGENLLLLRRRRDELADQSVGQIHLFGVGTFFQCRFVPFGNQYGDAGGFLDFWKAVLDFGQRLGRRCGAENLTVALLLLLAEHCVKFLETVRVTVCLDSTGILDQFIELLLVLTAPKLGVSHRT